MNQSLSYTQHDADLMHLPLRNAMVQRNLAAQAQPRRGWRVLGWLVGASAVGLVAAALALWLARGF